MKKKFANILFSRMPEMGIKTEFIIVCAKSEDLTVENAYKIKDEHNDKNIKVINQKSKGKAGAVYEAIENSNGDLLAILDSDLSVDPETLPTFLES